MEPRLKNIIIKEINPSLKEKFGYRSLYMGPKIEKIWYGFEQLYSRVEHVRNFIHKYQW